MMSWRLPEKEVVIQKRMRTGPRRILKRSVPRRLTQACRLWAGHVQPHSWHVIRPNNHESFDMFDVLYELTGCVGVMVVMATGLSFNYAAYR